MIHTAEVEITGMLAHELHRRGVMAPLDTTATLTWETPDEPEIGKGLL